MRNYALIVIFLLVVLPSMAASKYVYTVALEPMGDPCWDSVIYKIDAQKGKIAQKRKIAEEGAPMLILSVTPSLLCYIAEEGIFANGTFVQTPTRVKIYFVSAEDLRVQKVITLTDYSNPELVAPKVIRVSRNIHDEKGRFLRRTYRFYQIGVLSVQETTQPPTLSELNQPSPLRFPLLKRFKGRPEFPKSEIPLVMIKETLLTLSSYRPFDRPDTIDLHLLSVQDLNIRKTIKLFLGKDKIVMNPYEEDSLILDGRRAVIIFEGASSIGHYVPSYVLILDLKTEKQKWIEIGSDPPVYKSVTTPGEVIRLPKPE